MEVCSNKHLKHSTVHLGRMSWRLKVLHSCVSSSYGEWAVQDRAEELILPSAAAYRLSRLSPVTQLVFFFVPVCWACRHPQPWCPPHTENSALATMYQYKLQSSLLQILDDTSLPGQTVSVCLCCHTGPSCYMIWTPITWLHHPHILSMDRWQVSLASCSAGRDICHRLLHFTSTFNMKSSVQYSFKVAWHEYRV